jgi:hypothetical protein
MDNVNYNYKNICDQGNTRWVNLKEKSVSIRSTSQRTLESHTERSLFQGQGYIMTNSQYALVFSPIADYWPEFAFSLKIHVDRYRFVIV